MDALRFADLARAFVTTGTRRATLGLGAAGLLGVLGLDDADAKRKKGKNKNKNKKKCKKCGACQACKKGKCKPAAAGTPCGEGQQCFADGTCHACDVASATVISPRCGMPSRLPAPMRRSRFARGDIRRTWRSRRT